MGKGWVVVAKQDGLSYAVSQLGARRVTNRSGSAFMGGSTSWTRKIEDMRILDTEGEAKSFLIGVVQNKLYTELYGRDQAKTGVMELEKLEEILIQEEICGP